MENRHVAVNARPPANSKARRAEKEIPDWKFSPKRNNNKKDANNNVRICDTAQQRQQQPRQSVRGGSLATRRRSGGRLRSPSLPSISEARHYSADRGNDDDHPKTACPIVPQPPQIEAICPLPRSIASTGDASEAAAATAAAVQGLRKSNEALLELVTELISLVPTHFPVHEMIRRREEARVLADTSSVSAIAAAVGMQGQQHRDTTMTLEKVSEKKTCKVQFMKGHKPRSKSSVF
ncbi:hypothetical protein PG993_011711 [Apiospora rasikravindrae]|uniref:Uncharacterized protein n=1 Tax=Apiospora rasikravindrae TaxID=990691 RepID=A0ABR1S1U6_9PEZI